MTWPRYMELEQYWIKFPPIGSVLSSFVSRRDGGARSRESAPRDGFGTMEDLAREMANDPAFRVR